MLSLTRSRHVQPVRVQARRAIVLDVLGAGLFFGTGAWMAWTSVESGGSALPGVGLLLACGLVLMIARTIGPHGRVIVPAAVLLAAVIVAARSKTGVLSSAPLAGPLEYGNANGAFYAQAAIAGLMLASSAPQRLFRIVGGAGAGAFAVLTLIVHAVAAAWLVVILSGIALVAAAIGRASGARASVTLFGSAFAASLGITILLGASYSPAAEPNVFERATIQVVDEVRVMLWHDAFVIMRDHPATGVGPGRYQIISPIGSKDPDSRWAHNEFLQQGAEGGIVALALLAGIFVWVFSRLWVVPVPDAITALSAASLAALGIHACIDYVMHYPAISIMAAALVGAGMIDGADRSSQTRSLPSSWGAT